MEYVEWIWSANERMNHARYNGVLLCQLENPLPDKFIHFMVTPVGNVCQTCRGNFNQIARNNAKPRDGFEAEPKERTIS